MAKSVTHNEVTLRPPPGTRFTIWGSDVVLQFERGREREVVNSLREWIDNYIEPEAFASDARKTAEKKVKEEEHAKHIAKMRSTSHARDLIEGLINSDEIDSGNIETDATQVTEVNHGDTENHGKA